MMVATVEAALLTVLKKVQNVSYRISVQVATTEAALQVHVLEGVLEKMRDKKMLSASVMNSSLDVSGNSRW